MNLSLWLDANPQPDGLMGAGRYNKDVNRASFASGVYFYRITAVGNNAERFVAIKKLRLLK